MAVLDGLAKGKEDPCPSFVGVDAKRLSSLIQCELSW